MGAAWMNHKEPPANKVGFMYVLRGDGGASNADPYATKEEPGNNCIKTGAHVISRVTRFPVVFRAHGCPLAPFDGRLATRLLAEDGYFLAMKPVGRFLGCRHPAVQR